MARIEDFFQVRQAGSTFRREALAGLTTFLAMAYILFVNPAVLSRTGMDFGAVFTATCLSAAAATLIMGVWANFPVALAPGMGQNFFFLTVVTGMGIAWQKALGAVFISGVVFLALTVTRARAWIIEMMPDALKQGIAAGIGLFIALIGLVNAGVVTQHPTGLLRVGHIAAPAPLLAFLGLAVTAALAARRVSGAILAGIGVSTVAAAGLGLVRFEGFMSAPPSLAPTFLRMDLTGLMDRTVAPVILVFLYMALFDAVGTLVAVGGQAGLMKDGKLMRAERALAADATGTVVGAALGTSTVTAYVESAAGIEAGGRTGLTSVVTACLLAASLFFAPLVRMIGGGVPVEGGAPLHPLTAPALILVGAMMARGFTRIRWDDLTETLPAFLVMVGIPFTFSIADGLALGFIAYPSLKLLAGRGREVPWPIYVLGGLFAARFLIPA
ncbi:MAG TPA: NCS2 family permease [Candidatus Polarisedimenticolia bacterium]|nr:NCS2 family permease [Candidatus Polarisedimenticolia bacterium]